MHSILGQAGRTHCKAVQIDRRFLSFVSSHAFALLKSRSIDSRLRGACQRVLLATAARWHRLRGGRGHARVVPAQLEHLFARLQPLEADLEVLREAFENVEERLVARVNWKASGSAAGCRVDRLWEWEEQAHLHSTRRGS